MEPNKDQKTSEPDPISAPPENQKAAAQNENVVEALAAAVKPELLKLFDQDLAQAIANARAHGDYERQKRALAAEQEMRQGVKKEGISRKNGCPRLNEEQQAEWLRCTALAMHGPFQVDPDLDEDGAVSQALAWSGVPQFYLGDSPGVKQAARKGAIVRQAYAATSDAAGAYTIPDDVRTEIERRPDTVPTIWPMIKKLPTGRDTVTKAKFNTYPSVNKGTSAKAGSATTTDEITETEGTFTELTWTMRYFDAYHEIKLDLLRDSAANIQAELNDVIREAFDVEREREPLIGNGVSRPKGMLNAISGITTEALGGDLTFTRLLNLLDGLTPKYRANASVVTSTKLLFNLIDDMATNINSGEFLQNFLPMLQQGRLVDSEYFTGDHEGKVLYGNFQKYEVYYNALMWMTTAVAPRRFAMGFAFVEKWDGQVVDTNAFRIGTASSYS